MRVGSYLYFVYNLAKGCFCWYFCSSARRWHEYTIFVCTCTVNNFVYTKVRALAKCNLFQHNTNKFIWIYYLKCRPKRFCSPNIQQCKENKINKLSRESGNTNLIHILCNVESKHKNKLLAFKLECMKFLQSCKCLIWMFIFSKTKQIYLFINNENLK